MGCKGHISCVGGLTCLIKYWTQIKSIQIYSQLSWKDNPSAKFISFLSMHPVYDAPFHSVQWPNYWCHGSADARDLEFETLLK